MHDKSHVQQALKIELAAKPTLKTWPRLGLTEIRYDIAILCGINNDDLCACDFKSRVKMITFTLLLLFINNNYNNSPRDPTKI